MFRFVSSLALTAVFSVTAFAQIHHFVPPKTHWPVKNGTYVVHDFHFKSGETLPDLKLHYLTLGTPHRDAAGHTDNAVLLLQGPAATPGTLLNPVFSDVLFGPGQPLDITKYFIILTDDIGHGESTQAFRRPADEVSALRLRRHGRASARHAPQRPACGPSAADPRHLDGLHAGVRLGRDLSRTFPMRSRPSPAFPWKLPGATACGATWPCR